MAHQDDDDAQSRIEAEGWQRDFERDGPLYTYFPVTLANGKSIPALHIVCDSCGGLVSGAAVRGRVIKSLPHVVTVTANGICAACARITHVDCRFRAHADNTIIEWLGSNGRWRARAMQETSRIKHVVDLLVRSIKNLVSR
jgi:hypothetical protein